MNNNKFIIHLKMAEGSEIEEREIEEGSGTRGEFVRESEKIEYFAADYRTDRGFILNVTRKGKLLFNIHHDKMIKEMVFSDNGQKLLTYDTTHLVLYDTSDGRVIISERLPFTDINLRITDDGKHFYAIASRKGTIWIVRVKDGNFKEKTLTGPAPNFITLSNDLEHWLSLEHLPNGEIAVFLDGEPLIDEENPSFCFSPDSRKVVFLSEDDLSFFDVETGKEIKTIKTNGKAKFYFFCQNNGKTFLLNNKLSEAFIIDFKTLTLVTVDIDEVRLNSDFFTSFELSEDETAIVYSRDLGCYEIRLLITVDPLDKKFIYVDRLYIKRMHEEPEFVTAAFVYSLDYEKILKMIPAIRSLYSLQRQHPMNFPDLVLANIVGEITGSDNPELIRFLLDVGKSKRLMSKEEMLDEIRDRL